MKQRHRHGLAVSFCDETIVVAGADDWTAGRPRVMPSRNFAIYGVYAMSVFAGDEVRHVDELAAAAAARPVSGTDVGTCWCDSAAGLRPIASGRRQQHSRIEFDELVMVSNACGPASDGQRPTRTMYREHK